MDSAACPLGFKLEKPTLCVYRQARDPYSFNYTFAADRCASLEAHLPSIHSGAVTLDARCLNEFGHLQDRDFFAKGDYHAWWLGLECDIGPSGNEYHWDDGTPFDWSWIPESETFKNVERK